MTEKLLFNDYFMGSGRAETDCGWYLVSDSDSGIHARFSDGKNWVWDGGYFESHKEAHAYCQSHHDNKGTIPARSSTG